MATNAEKLQLAESDLRKLDDEIAKNAEDRRQLLQVILSREKVKEDCEHLWQQMASLEVDRDNLQTDKKEKKLAVEHLKQTLAAEAADGAPSTIAAVPDADGPRDQQAAAHSSPAPLRESAVWWPASWLQSVAPLWQVRGDAEGSLWQRQQQEGPTAAMLASAGLQSAGDPHASAIANSVPNSSAPPPQYLSTCRQRRSRRADPQQAASEGTP
ncbi:hypothetical protein HYH02_005888 [Chlamydomonas schloesseri]|uniref:Uncharacterized protein n=1 Tax=Chlamydomonas schloesseri TaxID=2026947 RepID=A0A835WKJ1_9CHLO|nr:hypothetical protein HYH02_005888 [Chlamydomonas schloesseri]|eukprot:KAG2449140.1 hypothetical protein HYH02_005888 [Chlamydomonas schloesseri]